MLLANSFLLIATAYATNDPAKNINANPTNARQNIQEIILSNWAEKNVCSIVLFDKSWSMFYDENGHNSIDPQTQKLKIVDKWIKAVSWAIKYSELLLNQDLWAKVWLVTFGRTAEIKHHLDRTPFQESDFTVPSSSEDTYLDLWLNEAIREFSWKNECTLKYIIIMSDWEPSRNDYKNAVIKAKNNGIILYSIWYEVNDNKWGKTLRSISAWWYYNTRGTNIEQIFEQLAKGEKYTSISTKNQKLKLTTNNFILTQSWTQDYINDSSDNSIFSNILWWKWNIISAQSSKSTIIAWNKNSIQSSDASTIPWWELNQISASQNSTIIWWYNNTIDSSNNSSIWWWHDNNINDSEYSTIIWNNNAIRWKTSVAMGAWIKNYWDNSFYWTDNTQNNQLNKSNVFAVVSNNWMVINTDTPHTNAKLTISWNLAIKPNTTDENIVCWDWNWKWIIKAIKKNDNEECLCSCNWNNRESLHNWVCKWLCNNEVVTCWATVSFSANTYHWTCNSWTAIYNSYYVTNDNIIHRACQWFDGSVVTCTWNLQ